LPKRSLSDLAVKRMKPPASGQVDMFDLGYPGFALRTSYGGSKSWVYFYRLGDRQRRLTLGHYPSTSLGDARELWRQAREQVAHGRDPARELTTGDNFESVVREWLKRDQSQNRSFAEVERIVDKELIPAWGHRSIKDIGRRDVLSLMDAIADRGAVIMARRVMAYVHRLFRWAVSRGITDSNPASDLPKPGKEIRRERVLDDDELKKVWTAAEKLGWPYGSAVQLLILTGARRAEISELRWSEVNGESISLKGARTKNGEARNIPLSREASKILSGIPRVVGNEFVFGGPLRGGWSQAKDRLAVKISDWRVHDLRRTTATGLQRLGFNLQVIESVLGHTSGSRSGIVATYQRYSFEKETRAALDAWGAQMSSLVAHP
jgi:integrase